MGSLSHLSRAALREATSESLIRLNAAVGVIHVGSEGNEARAEGESLAKAGVERRLESSKWKSEKRWAISTRCGAGEASSCCSSSKHPIRKVVGMQVE